jgi:hypothetical protein
MQENVYHTFKLSQAFTGKGRSRGGSFPNNGLFQEIQWSKAKNKANVKKNLPNENKIKDNFYLDFKNMVT